MSGPRKHHSGAQKIKCTFLKHDSVRIKQEDSKIKEFF